MTDVGGDFFEEINIAKRGTNHQWSYREGPDPVERSYLAGIRPEPFLGTESEPFFDYHHSGTRRCIIGGPPSRRAGNNELRSSEALIEIGDPYVRA